MTGSRRAFGNDDCDALKVEGGCVEGQDKTGKQEGTKRSGTTPYSVDISTRRAAAAWIDAPVAWRGQNEIITKKARRAAFSRRVCQGSSSLCKTTCRQALGIIGRAQERRKRRKRESAHVTHS